MSKRQLTELELLKLTRAALIAQRSQLTAEIQAIEKKIAELQAKVKNPVPKRRVIEFLKPIMGDRGWTYEEMFKSVFDSDQIPHLNLEKNFKTSITRAIKERTLEIRSGRYYLRNG